MFEAVGEKYWSVYFRQIKSLLKIKGKALIQTIMINDPYFERYRNTGDMLFSMSRLQQKAKIAGLNMSNKFAFGQDYATTL